MSVKRLPREAEAQQQLSVLAPSMWEQSLDIFNFAAELWRECGDREMTREAQNPSIGGAMNRLPREGDG